MIFFYTNQSISQVLCGPDSRGMDSGVFLGVGTSFPSLTMEALRLATSSQPRSHPHTSTHPLTLSLSCASGCSLSRSIFSTDYTQRVLLRNASALNKPEHSAWPPKVLTTSPPPGMSSSIPFPTAQASSAFEVSPPSLTLHSDPRAFLISSLVSKCNHPALPCYLITSHICSSDYSYSSFINPVSPTRHKRLEN